MSKHRIVVGVDGSASSLHALRWAARQAELTGAAVDAVIAWQYPFTFRGYGWGAEMMTGDVDYAEIAAKTVGDAISRAVDLDSRAVVYPVVAEGHPAQVLIEAAAGADLLVVGSRGNGSFTSALLGSVSQHCTHHSRCPVVVIRGPDER